MADVAHSTTNIAGGHTSASASVAGFQSATDKAKQDGAGYSIDVRMTTVVAIPAYTYANGAAGVGATLTGNANGAAAAIDAVTPALNDLMYFSFGVNAFENGVYKLTQVGDGSNPFIWTRSTLADTSGKILGSRVNVLDGAQGKGVYQFQTNTAVTIGTDALFWLRVSVGATPVEVLEFIDDFCVAGLPSAPIGFGDKCWVGASVAGAGAAVSIVSAANSTTRIGILQLATGTTTTGRATLFNAVSGTAEGHKFQLGTNVAFFGQFKLQVSALSDGTDTYQVFVGISDATTPLPPTNCVGVMYTQASDTHWRAITSSAGTSTITNSAATVTAAVDDVITVVKDAGTNVVRIYANNVLVVSGSSNVPTSTAIGFCCTILKSAGTTSRNTQIDFAHVRITMPQRRAA
jgi:hypothetical protein